MARVIGSTTLRASDGLLYDVRICGRQLADHRWESWIEFVSPEGSPVLRTPRETTQPTLGDLTHWATGLTSVYLDGALTRAEHAALGPHIDVGARVPFYDAPALDPHDVTAVPSAGPAGEACESMGFVDVEGAVLDPISVYAKGEATLRQKLGILSADHLRRIARGYRLVPSDARLDAFTEPELIELIVAGVRTRCAA